jgi:arabinan endo-1,5-alpha-L-arabinosidase
MTQGTPETQRKPVEAVDRTRLAETGALILQRLMKVGWPPVLAAALAGLLTFCLPLHAADQPRLTGDTRIHDPSVIEVDGRFAAFGTGRQGPTHGAIQVKTSPDGIHWTDAGAIGKGAPRWAIQALGFQPTSVWAPSISRRGATFNLYYCLSSFGSNASAIGLMTSASFDVTKPGEGWNDRGLVLMSKPGDDFNAIDPFRIDLIDGRAYLAYGSFWSGIKLRELDPETGKLKENAPVIALERYPNALNRRASRGPGGLCRHLEIVACEHDTA